MGVRLLVLGGTNYNTPKHVYRALDQIHEERTIGLLITGAGDGGAEEYASKWASNKGVPKQAFLFHLSTLRQPRHMRFKERDQRMLDEGKPDLILAFDVGSGARRIIKRAEEKGIEVLMFYDEE